jgi:glucokinase
MNYEVEHLITQQSFNTNNYSDFVIAIDVGGTNLRIALVGVKEKKFDIIFFTLFSTKKISSLVQSINETMKIVKDSYGIAPDKACVAFAGPVNPQRTYCKLTNANWGVDVYDVVAHTNLKNIILLNDFEALGYTIDLIKDDKASVVTLPHKGNKIPSGAKDKPLLVIGAGTGLGKCLLIFDKEKNTYVSHASEGGHVDFSAQSDGDWDLVKYVMKKTGKIPICYEDFVSGRGLVNIYDFLSNKKYKEKNSLRERFNELEEDKKPEFITENCEKDPICEEAVDIFIKLYARAIKNSVLEFLATGGVYITGGISPHIVEHIKKEIFMEEFENNATYRSILEEVPVHVIINKNVGLLGAANVAANFSELYES